MMRGETMSLSVAGARAVQVDRATHDLIAQLHEAIERTAMARRALMVTVNHGHIAVTNLRPARDAGTDLGSL
jgi:hypothetical protein